MSSASTSLRLRVVPGAARAGIAGRYGEGWKVRVAAPPEHGRANAAVLDLLSSTLGVPRGDVTLERGVRSRDKVVALAHLTPEVAEARLSAAAERTR
jgi:uncharacterized protein (TIGR00251 family)